MTTMTTAERASLNKLERIIEAGKSHFLAVGRALAEISERKLYRDKFATFPEYCEKRWGFGKSQAYRLIDAAEINDRIGSSSSPIGDIPESQLRELKNEPPEVQKAAAKYLNADAEATAAKIKKLLAEGTAEEKLERIKQAEAEAEAGLRAMDEAARPKIREQMLQRLQSAAQQIGWVQKNAVKLEDKAEQKAVAKAAFNLLTALERLTQTFQKRKEAA